MESGDLGKLGFYLTVEVKTYCCQFETFAKLGVVLEGGWCSQKICILCAKNLKDKVER